MTGPPTRYDRRHRSNEGATAARTPRGIVPVLGLVFILASCQEAEPHRDALARSVVPHVARALETIAIGESDVPAGLHRDQLDNGPAALEAILLPEGVVASRPMTEAYVAGYQSAFYGRLADHEDGLEARVASAVMMFDVPTAASSALDALVSSPGALERLRKIGAHQAPMTGLGDESYRRAMRSAVAEIFTYVWRNGRFVIVLAAGGGVGSFTDRASLALARVVDARIPAF